MISERLGSATGGSSSSPQDIMFNLMAVVPDKIKTGKHQLFSKIKMLIVNRYSKIINPIAFCCSSGGDILIIITGTVYFNL